MITAERAAAAVVQLVVLKGGDVYKRKKSLLRDERLNEASAVTLGVALILRICCFSFLISHKMTLKTSLSSGYHLHCKLNGPL